MRTFLQSGPVLSLMAALGVMVPSSEALAQSQPGQRIATAPGVTRSVRPSGDTPATNTPPPDSQGKPQSAVDDPTGKPESAKDDPTGKPEPAHDDPTGKPESARDDPNGKPESAKDDSTGKPESARDDPAGKPQSAKD
jgi:hypothetical protein